MLALLLSDTRRHGEARSHGLRALALGPDDAANHAAMGRIHAATGDGGAAAAHYRAALARDPALFGALSGLGLVLLANGDFLDASEILAQAVQLRPDDGQTARAYAAALVQAGDAASAIRATMSFPDNGVIAHALGQVLLRSGRAAEAVHALTAAAALLPADPAVRHDLGTACQAASDRAGAIAAFRDALSRDGARADTWHDLGGSLQSAGDMDGAMAAYGRSYALNPVGFARIAQELAAGNPGRVWLRAGDLRHALAAAADPRSPDHECHEQQRHEDGHDGSGGEQRVAQPEPAHDPGQHGGSNGHPDPASRASHPQ